MSVRSNSTRKVILVSENLLTQVLATIRNLFSGAPAGAGCSSSAASCGHECSGTKASDSPPSGADAPGATGVEKYVSAVAAGTIVLPGPAVVLVADAPAAAAPVAEEPEVRVPPSFPVDPGKTMVQNYLDSLS